jgi:hypothetical protein
MLFIANPRELELALLFEAPLMAADCYWRGSDDDESRLRCR